MGRTHIRPPGGYYDWPKEQQLEWIRQLQAEVLGEDYEEEGEG